MSDFEFEHSPSQAEYENMRASEAAILKKIEHYEKQKEEISKWINVARIVFIVFQSVIALGVFSEVFDVGTFIAYVIIICFLVFVTIIVCKFVEILLFALCDQVIETCKLRFEARK